MRWAKKIGTYRLFARPRAQEALANQHTSPIITGLAFTWLCFSAVPEFSNCFTRGYPGLGVDVLTMRHS